MPIFTVNTNVSANNVPKDFKARATDVIAKSLGKPVSYIAVHVNPGQNISFGGIDEPAALCDLVSIGALSVDSNKLHTQAIMELLEETLKVSPYSEPSYTNSSDGLDIYDHIGAHARLNHHHPHHQFSEMPAARDINQEVHVGEWENMYDRWIHPKTLANH